MGARILFLDVGGTLIRERSSRHDLYAAAAARHGLAVAPPRMRELMRAAHAALPLEIDGCFRYGDAWFRRFIERIFRDELGLAPARLATLQDELFATFEDPATFEVERGARELVDAARAAGWRVGIVSNWSARLPRLLARLGFDGAFDPLVCSALVGCEKPSERIFEIALERAGAAAHDALHAGDRDDNDGAAVDCGIHTVIVGPIAEPRRSRADAEAAHDPRGAARRAQLARVSDLVALRTYILGLPR